MGQLLSKAFLVRGAILFAAWTAYGLLCGWQTHYWFSFSKTPMPWAESIRFEVTYAWMWALATPLVLWASRRYRLERQLWPKHLLVHFCLLLAVIPATKIAYDAIAMPETSPFRHFSWGALFRSVEAAFDTGLLLYTVVVLIEHALAFYRRYQTGLVKASKLQTELIQAQLQALKMQLHPHFLFNTLHTVTALVHEDPDRAERTITRLGELLRLFLANSAVHEVSLDEELRVLDLYLEIERARFEERLRIHYDVPAALREATVPSLVLQPLVENSIRHGLGKRAGPGWISITAELFGQTLVLRVTDDGAGFQENAKPSAHQGMGLGITRGRLESLYGTAQSFVLRNLPAGGTEARITLPFKIYDDGVKGNGDHVELQSTDR